nr:cupredoxin family copper-binding protein [Caldimonas brevitalea]
MSIAATAFGATHTVTMEGMQFSPPSVTVKQGDKVVWVNKDVVPHTATVPKGFDSGSVAPGQSWATTPKRGSYDYVCTLHPTMKAKLIVE